MDFLSGSIRLGSFAGINVRLHMWYLIWMGFQLFESGGAWQSTLTFLGLLFAIVLLHEFGHCFGARAVGGDAREILMWPLGGLAFAEAPMRPWPQFVTVACGPLVNVVFCVVSAIVLIVATGTPEVVSINPFVGSRISRIAPAWMYYTGVFYDVNLFLLAFNLLPVFPFDGGQLFRTLIWPFVGLRRATLYSTQLGILGAIVLGGLGLMWQHFMLVIIAIFGAFTCWQHYMAAKHGYMREDSESPIRVVRPRRGAWLSRLFGGRRSSASSPPAMNPNPGGWQAKLEKEERLEDDVDRILKKVSENGIQSLSYIERQTLERATRERQAREREFGRGGRL